MWFQIWVCKKIDKLNLTSRHLAIIATSLKIYMVKLTKTKTKKRVYLPS